MCSDTVYKRVLMALLWWTDRVARNHCSRLMVAASRNLSVGIWDLSYWAKPPGLSTYTLSISEYPDGDACCREPQPLRVPATGEPSSPRRRPLTPATESLSPTPAPPCPPRPDPAIPWASEICQRPTASADLQQPPRT